MSEGGVLRALLYGGEAVVAMMAWSKSGYYEPGGVSVALAIAAGVGALVGDLIWKLVFSRRSK